MFDLYSHVKDFFLLKLSQQFNIRGKNITSFDRRSHVYLKTQECLPPIRFAAILNQMFPILSINFSLLKLLPILYGVYCIISIRLCNGDVHKGRKD